MLLLPGHEPLCRLIRADYDHLIFDLRFLVFPSSELTFNVVFYAAVTTLRKHGFGALRVHDAQGCCSWTRKFESTCTVSQTYHHIDMTRNYFTPTSGYQHLL
ncbi:hypothetical protein M378DRAFT_159494 [Amanita muscaria Koide BX008]|uniref:Uncharacterized protein n=1 Tax=Amanita muscaria (strain Koide BX008) TaxID=946122 RepID=A0A0C2TKU1_AMAMK|nr:hypothetical protein M378DRAFT_159494 [Amanita muscaria Koide BX008]